MSYKIKFLEKEGGIITSFSDVVTDENLIRSATERVSEEHNFKDFLYGISDFSNVTEFKVTTEGIKANARQAIEYSKLNKDFILVSVMPTDLEFGMARVWIAHAEESSWRTNTFRTFEEAQHWIKIQLTLETEE